MYKLRTLLHQLHARKHHSRDKFPRFVAQLTSHAHAYLAGLQAPGITDPGFSPEVPGWPLDRAIGQACPSSWLAGLILSHEQTHWLVLIAGHVVADAGEGETPCIPPELMELCVDEDRKGGNNPILQILAAVRGILDGERHILEQQRSDLAARLSSQVSTAAHPFHSLPV